MYYRWTPPSNWRGFRWVLNLWDIRLSKPEVLKPRRDAIIRERGLVLFGFEWRKEYYQFAEDGD